jgi:pimeloyl-ACP methyl ester carboxylesterase
MPDDVALVYFHGLPGSYQELSLFGVAPGHLLVNTLFPARIPREGESDPESYFDRMAEEVARQGNDRQIHLIGFSLGAVATLQVAIRLGNRVSMIDLVSAAAPLDTGNYLPDMAGRAVFELARKRPIAFCGLVKAQSFAARIAPRLLYNALFATAQGDDAALKADPHFRSVMSGILLNSLSVARSTYQREILFYVGQWSHILPRVTQPVTLWHGDSDNWSPPEMALALNRLLPASRDIRWVGGASHYATLRTFLDQLSDK